MGCAGGCEMRAGPAASCRQRGLAASLRQHWSWSGATACPSEIMMSISNWAFWTFCTAG